MAEEDRAWGSRETPVAHIDLMPTLAKAAGAGLPADVEIDGVDILPSRVIQTVLIGLETHSFGKAATTE